MYKIQLLMVIVVTQSVLMLIVPQAIVGSSACNCTMFLAQDFVHQYEYVMVVYSLLLHLYFTLLFCHEYHFPTADHRKCHFLRYGYNQ